MKKILILCLLCNIVLAMDNSDSGGITPTAVKKMYLGAQDTGMVDCIPGSKRLIDLHLAHQIIQTAPIKVQQALSNLLDDQLNSQNKPQKMLLVGEPGTGKSKIALAMMTILAEKGWGHKFIESALIANEYRNSGQQNINRIINSLQKNQNVITFDEITCLVDENEKSPEQNVSTATALWLIFDRCFDEGNKFFFIGTTNDIKKLPKAFKSRFDQDDMIIEVPLPSLSKRIDIISYYLHKDAHNFTKAEIEKLGKYTNKMSCREIEGAIRCSIQKAAFEKNSLSYEIILNSIKTKKQKFFDWEAIKDRTIIIIKNSIPYVFNIANMVLSVHLHEKQIKHSNYSMIESQKFQMFLSEQQNIKQEVMQEKNQKFQEDLSLKQLKENQNFQLYMYDRQKSDNHEWSWGRFFEGVGKICLQAMVNGAIQAAGNKYFNSNQNNQNIYRRN